VALDLTTILTTTVRTVAVPATSPTRPFPADRAWLLSLPAPHGLVFHHSGGAPFGPGIQKIRLIVVVTVSEEPVTTIPARNALRPTACHQAWRNAGS
jgi:hypothetical protein